MIEQVYDIINDIFEPSCELSEHTLFDEDLFADEQDMQELFRIIEEEFDILTDDDDIKKILTVGDLVNYINECKEKF